MATGRPTNDPQDRAPDPQRRASGIMHQDGFYVRRVDDILACSCGWTGDPSDISPHVSAALANETESIRQQAMDLLDERGPQAFSFRSCWKCNGAHEHLRGADYVINCNTCGGWFFRGYEITPPEEEKKKQ